MLTVLIGLDAAARAKRLAAFASSFEKKNIEVQSYTDVTFNPEHLRSLAGSNSLFGGGTFAIFLSGIADTADGKAELEKLIPVFVESEHQFVLSESSLLATFLKKADSKGALVEQFDKKASVKPPEIFNAFTLTDAYCDRKRSLAWALYRKAIDLGIEPRELHGKIFWAVKMMIIAEGTKTVGDSGLNPFVFGKAKRASANFVPGELSWQMGELAIMFHEALVSGLDLETALEAFILRALEKPQATLTRA